MGVVVKEMEIASPVPPAKLFKAFILDSDTLLPKVLPQRFKSIELLEGDGGPGSVKKIIFPGAEKVRYGKQRVEFVDKEKLVYHHSWIEGDVLRNLFEKISEEIKFEAGHGGGSVCKITTKFFVIGEAQIDEELLKGRKEKVVGVFKAVEAYVLANP